MAVEVNDNETIASLNEATELINKAETLLFGKHGVNIGSHAIKIQKLIDNAIKKERINILNAEIEKIKKGCN